MRISVGRLPTRSCWAKGQPPRPPIAESETAAVGGVRGADQVGCAVWFCVEVNADFDLWVERDDRGDEVGDEGGGGETDGIRERDLRDAAIDEARAGVRNLVDRPWIVVRVSEGHGDVDDQAEVRSGREGVDCEEFREGFFGSLVLVSEQEVGRNGVGIADGRDAARGEGTLRSFFVDDDADDLNV